jgi:hypothetical protein
MIEEDRVAVAVVAVVPIAILVCLDLEIRAA